MTTQQAIAILRQHNKWRRGDDTAEMQEPKDIGEAIEVVIVIMEMVVPGVDRTLDKTQLYDL